MTNGTLYPPKSQTLSIHNVPHFFTSSRHNLPWFTKKLKKLCKRKQRLYNKANEPRNQYDWQEFCDIRKNVHKQLRSASVSHISQFLTTSITDKPTSFWTFISKLTRARRHPAMVSEYVCRSTSSNSPQQFSIISRQ